MIENPIQFTIVNEVPLDSSGAFCATKVENNGESGITEIPQMNKNVMNRKGELEMRKSGERIQHKQEINNDSAATLFTPKYCDSIPPKTQANPPEAITKKDIREILIRVSG